MATLYFVIGDTYDASEVNFTAPEWRVTPYNSGLSAQWVEQFDDAEAACQQAKDLVESGAQYWVVVRRGETFDSMEDNYVYTIQRPDEYEGSNE